MTRTLIADMSHVSRTFCGFVSATETIKELREIAFDVTKGSPDTGTSPIFYA